MSDLATPPSDRRRRCRRPARTRRAGSSATPGRSWPTYGRPQRVLVRGEGCWVWDADGRRYLDLLGGIATSTLGHAHPLLVSTVTAQLATLGHVSNFFATAPQVALAERLLGILAAPAGSAVFFCNSGGRGQRGGVQDVPADRPHPDRRGRGRASTAARWAPSR